MNLYIFAVLWGLVYWIIKDIREDLDDTDYSNLPE
jgi:hypothetical protein